MPHPSLETLARRLSDCARCGSQDVCRQIVQHVARGKPVTRAVLSASLRMSQHHLSEQMVHLPDVEVDQAGNILGWGLTLVPTPYRLQMREQELSTWCAFDTIQLPPVLQAEARVHSTCAVTDSPISFVVSAEEAIRDLTPAARLSLIVPEHCGDAGDNGGATSVRATFCQQSLFFASEQAASTFLAAQPGAMLLPLEEAVHLSWLIATSASCTRTCTSSETSDYHRY
jgi:alkylmercury lyase